MNLEYAQAPHDFMDQLNAVLKRQQYPSSLAVLAASGNFDWTTDPEEVKGNFEAVRGKLRVGTFSVPQPGPPQDMTRLVTLAASDTGWQFSYYGDTTNPNPPSMGTVKRWRNTAAGVRYEANSPAAVVVHVPTGIMSVVSGNPKYLVHGTVGQTIGLMKQTAGYSFNPRDLWVVPSPEIGRSSVVTRAFHDLWTLAGVPTKQICSTRWDTQLNEPGLFTAAIY